MRISDWSSDVCSSDLRKHGEGIASLIFMGGPDNIAGLRIDPISTSDALQPFHCPPVRHLVEFIRFLSRLRLRGLLVVSPWITDRLRNQLPLCLIITRISALRPQLLPAPRACPPREKSP